MVKMYSSRHVTPTKQKPSAVKPRVISFHSLKGRGGLLNGDYLKMVFQFNNYFIQMIHNFFISKSDYSYT
jgi:hypothetical protein